MRGPHRIQQRHSDDAPLDRDAERLIVRISGDLGGKPGLPDRSLLERLDMHVEGGAGG